MYCFPFYTIGNRFGSTSSTNIERVLLFSKSDGYNRSKQSRIRAALPRISSSVIVSGGEIRKAVSQ